MCTKYVLLNETVGSLTIGKDADLQIYRKGADPLELMSEPVFVMINGEMVKYENL